MIDVKQYLKIKDTIRKIKQTTPGQRHKLVISFDALKLEPNKELT